MTDREREHPSDLLLWKERRYIFLKCEDYHWSERVEISWNLIREDLRLILVSSDICSSRIINFVFHFSDPEVWFGRS